MIYKHQIYNDPQRSTSIQRAIFGSKFILSVADYWVFVEYLCHSIPWKGRI